mgnify:CR=1 FL=1
MVCYNLLADKCRQIIKERKCGVDGLAIDIGVSYSTLRKLLRKEFLRPSTLHKIAEYLELT